MQFTELMMLYTAPLYWGPSPSFYAQQLKYLLLHLLDPKKPGFGRLKAHSSSGDDDTFGWRKNDQDAVQWILDTYEEVWLPGAKLLEEQGQVASEHVFNFYVRHRAEMFLDEKRLAACLDDEANVPRGTYLGFSVDWSLSSRSSLLWAPQLRICNYWPHSRSLAPDPLAKVSVPSPLEPEAAADVLEQDFWQRVETHFRNLRYHFGLGEAALVSGPLQFLSPAFYYARPTAMPATPEKFLDSTHLPTLETLSRTTLGTHDLLSADVIGAFLQGNLLTFRREIQQGNNLRAYYLVVPWLPAEGEWAEEVESELCFIAADMLAYIEFDAGYKVADIVTDLEMPQKSMTLWESTLNDAASKARNLQHLVAFESSGSRQKAATFKLVRQLRSSLLRLEAQVLTKTSDVLRLEMSWRTAMEGTTRFARRALTARPLPQVASLLENLRDTGPYKLYEEQVNLAARQAQQLRENFRGVSTALQDVLDQEQREEQEREERRGRVLSYGLAALVTVTAFPILIGELDWEQLQDEISKWSGVVKWIGGIFQTSHSSLVFVATVSASILIALLLGIILLTFLRLDRRRRVWTFLLPDQRRKSKVAKSGRKIVKVGQLARGAEPAIVELQKVASDSVAVAGSNEPEPVAALRQEIDAKDKEACNLLVEVWTWLDGRPQDPELRPVLVKVWNWLLGRPQKSKPQDTADAQALHAEVDRFIIRAELLDNRLVPFPLPLALCLYRYRVDVVSDFEFQQVLNWYGFTDEEVKKIKNIVEQNKHLPPRGFVNTLRQNGVSALHDKRIMPPTDEPSLPSLADGEGHPEPGATLQTRVDEVPDSPLTDPSLNSLQHGNTDGDGAARPDDDAG